MRWDEYFRKRSNIKSLREIPQNSPGRLATNTDVITVMLMDYSTTEDPHFKTYEISNWHNWMNQVNENFLEGSEIYPKSKKGVFSILKNTFRILSLEQTPQ